MQTEATTFHSDRLTLSGTFFLPDDMPANPQPLIVPCSGFTGLCRIHPARFARYLTDRGHLCFGFDYRGFADSQGERGRVVLEEQVRDIVHAVAFAASDPRVDSTRVILLGWGMGAGLVIDAARWLRGIVGIAAVNGFYNGARVQRTHRGDEQLAAFTNMLDEARAARVRDGELHKVDPFDLYPLDPQSRGYVDAVLRKTPQYDATGYTHELGDSLMSWDVEAHAPRMHTPLLVAHGSENRLHPTAEAQSLHDAWAGEKELFWLDGAGHTEFMHDDDPKFQTLAAHIEQWASRRFGAG